RDFHVTGVQTCALPISRPRPWPRPAAAPGWPAARRAGAARRPRGARSRTAAPAAPAAGRGSGTWRPVPAAAWSGPCSMQRGARALDLDQLVVDAFARGVDRGAHRVELLQRGGLAVLLQPQPLAQHLLHRLAHRVLLVAR